ncbi:hypothetical protein DL769_003831 [Monosporascus sp. CRB-8-3]|nr:hypothetical protein DL769_003831 [Monosporascus sp. CRB-8-3]
MMDLPPGFLPVIPASKSRKDDGKTSVLCISRSMKPIKSHGPRVRGYRWETKAQEPNRRLQTPSPTGGLPVARAAQQKQDVPLPELAGVFGLDFYVLKVQSASGDTLLEELFQELPPYCIVLLEDIDAVGVKRNAGNGEDEEGKQNKRSKLRRPDAEVTTPGCTLSVLLNVLDGVAPRESWIILMTSNAPEKLDEALLRLGRIDRKVYLGHIEGSGPEQMFRHMFEPDPPEYPDVADDDPQFREREQLDKAALKFATQIPDRVVTPAQPQECLLQHHDSAARAAGGILEWSV